MNSTRLLLASLASIALFSCGDSKTIEQKKTATTAVTTVAAPDSIVSFNYDRKLDLNQDLSGKSLQELRLLRNELMAKQGYCFMQADLRGYFSAYMKGYDSIMNARYEGEYDKKSAF